MDPPEWGVGSEGFARRYASNHGYLVIQNMSAFALDSTLHFDPRYRYSESSRLPDRVRNAIQQTFMTRRDTGERVFNWPNVAGNFAAGQISNAWYPDRVKTVHDGLIRSSLGIAYSALANIGREFWPDIKHRIFE